jgi:hypothetical protein
MLGISALKQTRVFQEFYEDGQRDGLEQGRQEGRQEGLEEGRQAGLEEGLEEGRQQESLALVQRLLGRRLGDLPEVWRVRFSVPKGIAWRPWACLPWRNWPRPCWTFNPWRICRTGGSYGRSNKGRC